MNQQAINETICKYIENGEISGCSLIVGKDGKTVYKNQWGFSEIKTKKPIAENSVYRLMSMTKCITALGVMRLVERGKLTLDTPISHFIPEFRNMRVSVDKRYEYKPGMSLAVMLPKLLFFRMEKIKTVPANRAITVRDLLSHSSGLEQGVVGLLGMMKDKSYKTDFPSQSKKYADSVLGFQPGEGTGYSPVAGFDMLLYICELASGMRADEFLKKEVFEPLDMTDTVFYPDESRKDRVVSLYCRKGKKLCDVTGSKKDLDMSVRRKNGYLNGSAGLFSTLEDYSHLAQMLCDKGIYNKERYLSEDTVLQMGSEAPAKHLEPSPGFVWGLGMQIRQDPIVGKSFATIGTYGWSGAFGTHFFVSPKDNMYCVFMTNRTDLGGSGSYISRKIEELVFGIYANR